jgi:hypothetical protein
MTPQAAADLLHAGGGLAASSDKDAMCKAFAEAVAEWCAKPKGQRGSFNDVFFDKLKGIDPKLAGDIMREVPVLMKLAGRAGQVVGAVSEVAKNGSGAAKALAIVMAGAYTAISGLGGGGGAADAMRNAVYGAFKGVGNRRFYPRFPDGMLRGQVIEVKGPGDYFRKPGQAADYQKISAPKEPIVLSCESCGADCESGPGGGCPGD